MMMAVMHNYVLFALIIAILVLQGVPVSLAMM